MNYMRLTLLCCGLLFIFPISLKGQETNDNRLPTIVYLTLNKDEPEDNRPYLKIHAMNALTGEVIFENNYDLTLEVEECIADISTDGRWLIYEQWFADPSLSDGRFVVDLSTGVQTLIDQVFIEDEVFAGMRWDASLESVMTYTTNTDRTRYTLKRFDVETRRTFDFLELDRSLSQLRSSQVSYFYDRSPDVNGNINVYRLDSDFGFAFSVPERRLLETISNSGRYVGGQLWLDFDDPTGVEIDFRFYDHIADQIITINDVNREIRVVQNPIENQINFDWAPVSDRIVYLDTDRRITIYDFETGMRTIFADYPAKAMDMKMLTLEFDWSPDERYISYTVDYGTDHFENYFIYVLDTQTGQHIEVDAFNQFQQRTQFPGVLRWVSEDTFVYVNFFGDLVRYNVTNSENVKLTNTPNIIEVRTNCAVG